MLAGWKSIGIKCTTTKWFAIFSHEKDFSFFKMLARICKAMTFSRRLKYKWKGNRWSVAIVAAEKSSAFARELPVIHYIHVINANAGWVSVPESLYNSCNITTCVTRLLALVTRLRMAHFIVLLSRAPLSSPLFTLACFFSFFLRRPKMLAREGYISSKKYSCKCIP